MTLEPPCILPLVPLNNDACGLFGGSLTLAELPFPLPFFAGGDGDVRESTLPLLCLKLTAILTLTFRATLRASFSSSSSPLDSSFSFRISSAMAHDLSSSVRSGTTSRKARRSRE